MVATQASLRSTEEINAVPTSYTPFRTGFSGASTALATIGGVYDGDQGTDTLTFQVKKKAGNGAQAGPSGARQVFWRETGWIECPIFDRESQLPTQRQDLLGSGVVMKTSARLSVQPL